MEISFDRDTLWTEIQTPGCVPSGLPSECYDENMHMRIAGILRHVLVQKLAPNARLLQDAVDQLRRRHTKPVLAVASEYIEVVVIIFLEPSVADTYRGLIESIATPIETPARPTIPARSPCPWFPRY